MYEAKDFSQIKGTIFSSDNALDLHFKLYQGYVKNTNDILKKLEDFRLQKKGDYLESTELKRRLGWEFNGMRLHEFFFPQIGGDGKIDKEGKLFALMEKSFGSYEEWLNDFVATSKMRGIGWVILYQDETTGNLFNFWIGEHNENHLASGNLILILDVFEHSFILDYGTDRTGYIENFFKNIDWGVIEKRIV